MGPNGKKRRWAELPLCAAFVVLCLPLFISAQQTSTPQAQRELKFYTQPYKPASSAEIRRSVFLVEVDVVVRSADGHAVAGLRRTDFKVYDNGQEQTITQFAVERATPKIVSSRPAAAASAAAATEAKTPPAAAVPTRRYVGLFFDDRSMHAGDLRDVRLAADKFVREDLHAGDEVGVFTASGLVAQDFTSDTAKVLQAIGFVQPQELERPPFRPSPCTEYGLGPYAAYLMIDRGDAGVRRLYLCQSGLTNGVSGPPVALPQGTRAAVAMRASGLPTTVSSPHVGVHPPTEPELELQAQAVLSSAEMTSKFTLRNLDSLIAYMARMPGQRVVVLISSGFFTSSLQQEVDKATRNALNAGVVVSALDAKGLTTRVPGGDIRPSSPFSFPASSFERMLVKSQRNEEENVMSELARDTGGIFFHNNNDLASGLRRVAALPEVSYRLGFSPTDLKQDGRFHHVKVTSPGSFSVQARRGYFPPTAAARQAQAKVDRLNEEVLRTGEIAEIPVQVKVQPGRLPSGGAGFQISLRIDSMALLYLRSQGRNLDKLSLVTSLFDGAGKYVTGEIGLVDMALGDDTLEALRRRGLNATMVLQAPAGHYRLRVVIEDAGSGKMFATTRPTSIP